MDHLLVITTCPNQECAEKIAHHLVAEHLAACVNIVPGIRSVYDWKDQIVTDQEFLLLVKTRADAYERVQSAIKAQHPYELPEVIAISIAHGSRDYLAWINSLVKDKP